MTSHPHSDKCHLPLLTILFIFIVMVTVLLVAECAGSLGEGTSAGIIIPNSMKQPDKTEIIFDITYPLEDDVIYYDVLPAYLTVEGTISGSNGIRNVTVTYGNESAECGRNNNTIFDVPCKFLINDNIKKIVITVVDNQGSEFSETRNFTTILGLFPPDWFVVSGNVMDTDGNPVRNAFLTFETEIKGYGPFSVNTTTDRHGKYWMKKTRGFQQKITVRKSGYEILVRDVTLRPGYNNEQNFTLSLEKSTASGFDFMVTAFAIMIIFMVTYIRKNGRLK